MARIDTLDERREVLTNRFFRKAVMPQSSCLESVFLTYFQINETLTFLINFGALKYFNR